MNNVYAGTSAACYSCHAADFAAAADPNHVAGNYDHTCSQCHSTSGWAPAAFDHALSTFPLSGQHVSASCNACHVNGQYNGTPRACFACHQAEYQSADDPNHAAAQFPHGCESCHTPAAWEPTTFSHSATAFPLTGAHITASCAQCHVNGQFTGLPAACWSCHEADFTATTNPNHPAAQFSHSCVPCHTTTSWDGGVFDHSTTAFSLTGAHTAASCIQCHTGEHYAGTSSACIACHEADFTATTNPNHAAGNFAPTCADCHSTAAWSPAEFDHALAAFPLTGAHVTVACNLCHVNGQYTGTPSDCWSCHQGDYQAAPDPNHVAGNYPHTCAQCHATSGWDGAQFDHSLSGFPLTGTHLTTICTQCHTNGQYTGTPNDCWSCHQANYTAAADPSHTVNQFPHECNSCHRTAGWQPSTFDHATTAFPLTNAHATVSCAECHTGGQYQNLATDCWSCHQTNYRGHYRSPSRAGRFCARLPDLS